MSGQWSAGLFGCCDDCTLCLMTYVVPCYVYGKTHEKLEEGSCLKCGVGVLSPASLCIRTMVRGKIREAKGIEGSCVSDFLTVAFCGICAVVQEAREMGNELCKEQKMERS